MHKYMYTYVHTCIHIPIAVNALCISSHVNSKQT